MVTIDHFGNLITNIPEAMALNGVWSQVICGGRSLGAIQHTYADVAVGQPLALIGSRGMLELAVRHGDARHALGVSGGDRVELVR